MTTRLLHLSDLHFGAASPWAVEALARFIDVANPDVVVVSGDLTQRARAIEFAAARGFLDRVAKERVLCVVPGNHDIPLFSLWDRFFRPYARFARHFQWPGDTTLDVGNFFLVPVNSTRWYRHRLGTLGSEQVRRVAARLSLARPSQTSVVVLHHPPPLDPCSLSDAKTQVHRREESRSYAVDRIPRVALEVWAEAGMNLLLCGHRHQPRVRALGAGDGPWLVQGGTSISHRLRQEPNSVYLLERNSVSPVVRVERWDCRDEDRDFVMRGEHRLGEADAFAS